MNNYQMPYMPAAPRQKGFARKLIVCILAMIIGFVSITLGADMADSWDGDYVSSQYYGGDAYTGIQQASAATANNVRYTTEAVNEGFGNVLIIMGILIILGAIYMLPTKATVAPVAPAFAPAQNFQPQQFAAPNYQQPQQNFGAPQQPFNNQGNPYMPNVNQ